MPACTICGHKDVALIDHALLNGDTTRQVEKRFGVGRASLSRHRRHISPAKVAVMTAETQMEPAIEKSKLPALDQLRLAVAGEWRTIQRAEQAGNLGTAIQGYKTLIDSIQKLGEANGEFQKDAPGVKGFIELMDGILRDQRAVRAARTIEIQVQKELA